VDNGEKTRHNHQEQRRKGVAVALKGQEKNYKRGQTYIKPARLLESIIRREMQRNGGRDRTSCKLQNVSKQSTGLRKAETKKKEKRPVTHRLG